MPFEMDIITPRQILTEISSKDAYERFYRGTIDERLFMELMTGQPKLTPFHKICIKYMANEGQEEMPHMLAMQVGETWPKLTPEKKQALIDMANEGEIECDYGSIITALTSVERQRFHTQKQAEKDGYVQLYEDDGVKLTCTLTYAANCHYFGHTKWCTASDIYGEYSGWQQFKDYADPNGEGSDEEPEATHCFLQLFIKKTGDLYQFTMDSYGEIEEACDKEDHEVTFDTLWTQWDKHSSITWENFFDNDINLYDLVKKTGAFLKHENVFMTKFINKKIKEIGVYINEAINSPKFEEDFKMAILRHIEGLDIPDLHVGEVAAYDMSMFNFARTQLGQRYSGVTAKILPKDRKYTNFIRHYGGEGRVLAFFDTVDKEVILCKSNCKKTETPVIYGIIGLYHLANGFVTAAINLNTKEIIPTDESTLYYFMGGHLGLGQCPWKIYNCYTGRLEVSRAFHLQPAEDDNYLCGIGYTESLAKDAPYKQLQFLSRNSYNAPEEMKRINEIINGK